MSVKNLAKARSQRRWDNRYLRLAQLVATWSKDPKAQVGAVIVDARGRLCAIGYNGLPRQVADSDQRLTNTDEKLALIVHAEANAITIAGPAAVGGEIYVYGKPVCGQCAGLIIQAGLKRVIAEEPQEGTTSKWDKVGLLAKAEMLECGLNFHGMPKSELIERVREADALPQRVDKDQMQLFPVPVPANAAE